ncbi:MAG: hypothetical protein NC089_08510 [Bacteroides sp.]|nr:hypothetical protein [Bacteroides sp.]MCM1550898.1 hypothetical protein [Clostridium sp.]
MNYKAYGGGGGIPHSLLPDYVAISVDWMHLLQLIIYTRVTMSANYHWFQLAYLCNTPNQSEY